MANEVRALGELAAEATSGMAARIEEMHRAIAGRPRRGTGPAALPVHLAHDGIAGGVYAGVKAGMGFMVRAGTAAIAAALPEEHREVSRSRAGRIAISALNGAFGDRIAERHPDLAIDMAIRHEKRDVPIAAEGLASAFPEAGPRIALFIHGLGESDESWELFAQPGPDGAPETYATRLRRDLGHTPLHLRYNTGLRVSENGRRLAGLLDELVAAWPVELEDIVLVGHSMGGLVARSACHYGQPEDHAWIPAVRHVVTLGSPHLGSPVEQAANVGAWALAAVGETRPFAAMINARSAGVKDMRFGSILDEDWRDHEPDALLKDTCGEVPLLESATHCYISASLARDHRSPFGRMAGDLLVLEPSAAGRGRRRRISFELENGHHVGGLTHFHLLNHPAVYEKLHGWLVAG